MLFLLRHGQTEWNVAGRYQGRLDSPLTALGERQAEALGRALAHKAQGLGEPLIAHVSPLGRAQRSADLAGRHLALDRRIEPRLAEVNLGAWDGLTIVEIEAEFPGAMAGTTHFDWYFRGPGAESFERLCDRVSRWLGELDDQATVAFTHGVTSRIVRGLYLGLNKTEMLTLPVPQDGFYVLYGGQTEFVSAAPTGLKVEV